MKWGNECRARSAVPRRAGWQESSLDELQAILWAAGWPPSPSNAVDGDRLPKCRTWTSYFGPPDPLKPLLGGLAAADDALAISFGDVDPCFGIRIDFGCSAAR